MSFDAENNLVKAFPEAGGYTIEEHGYSGFYQRILCPEGGAITLARHAEDRPYLLSVASEIGKILPSGTFLRIEQIGDNGKCEVSGEVGPELGAVVHGIPNSLGTHQSDGGRLEFWVDEDNIGARYEDPESLLLSPDAVQAVQEQDTVNLAATGLDQALSKLAAEHLASWANVDTPKLTARTVLNGYLNGESARIIYTTILELSDGLDQSQRPTLEFNYNGPYPKLKTPFKDTEPEKRSLSGNAPDIYLDLNTEQEYLLRVITERNRVLTHVKTYEYLEWLSTEDQSVLDTYAAMKKGGVSPSHEQKQDDHVLMKEAGLLDTMVQIASSVDIDWVDASEKDRHIHLEPGFSAWIDPLSGELQTRSLIKAKLLGWKAIYNTPFGQSLDGKPAGYSNLNTPLVYDPSTQSLTPHSFDDGSYILHPEASTILPANQAYVLESLALRNNSYFSGDLLGQLAKGQPIKNKNE